MADEAQSTGMSIDEAAGLLTDAAEATPEPAEERAPEPAPDDTEDQPEEEPADGDEPEAEAETEEEPEAEDAADPIEPPIFWTGEDKARFAQLPRDMQEIVAAKAQEGVTWARNAQREAAEERQKIQAEIERVSALKVELEQALPAAVDAFTAKWGGVDENVWAELAEINPAEYTKYHAEYTRDLIQLQRATQAKQQADALTHTSFVQAEAQKLSELAPELAHPETGLSKRKELADYLEGLGVPKERLGHITALEATLALKAMKHDQAQTKAKAVAIGTPTKSAAQKVTAPVKAQAIRPAAAPVHTSSKDKQVSALENRLSKTGSVEDAVSLLLAKGT